jgi:Mce-associated membrane protein
MSTTRGKLALGAVALAVVAVTLLAVVMQRVGSQSHSNGDRNAAAAATYIAGPSAKAAEAAAAIEVKATLSYNYKTLQADFATALKGLTPAFATTYKQTTAQQVTPLATQNHAISSANVAAGGVSEASANSATVLLFVDQTVQNTLLTTKARLDRSRIVVDMRRIDGKWLVNHLQPI